MYCLSCTVPLHWMLDAVVPVQHLTELTCYRVSSLSHKNNCVLLIQWFSLLFQCWSLSLMQGSGCFLWWYLSQGGLTGGQNSLSPHPLVTFERYENGFARMTPGLSDSYSIKSMNKPSVCFPADKVIAIDLWGTWVTIMKSVCCYTMNAEQSVCLFARQEVDK